MDGSFIQSDQNSPWYWGNVWKCRPTLVDPSGAPADTCPMPDSPWRYHHLVEHSEAMRETTGFSECRFTPEEYMHCWIVVALNFHLFKGILYMFRGITHYYIYIHYYFHLFSLPLGQVTIHIPIDFSIIPATFDSCKWSPGWQFRWNAPNLATELYMENLLDLQKAFWKAVPWSGSSFGSLDSGWFDAKTGRESNSETSNPSLAFIAHPKRNLSDKRPWHQGQRHRLSDIIWLS